jgi:hypothetical protein
MLITDVLRQAHGGELIARLAHQHELTPEDAAAVVDAVVPELSNFLERNTLSRGGLADLVGAIGHGHHEEYFDNPALIGSPQALEDGNAILGHITGSKDRSRGVADRAARASGIDAAIIRDMLPSIAGLMMGALSKQVKGSLGDVAARASGGFLPDKPLPQGRPFPQQQQPPQRQPAPQGGSTGNWDQRQDDGGVRMNPRGGLEMPDGIPQDPGTQGGSDRGQRGNPGQPLPMPGNRIPQVPGNADNPFGDLAEILRRGLGLPGGSGPIIIPLPGGGSFPFPIPGGDGQPGGQTRGPRGGAQMPRGETGGGGFPWPQGGGTGGQQDGGQGTGFPWPQGGGMGGGNQGGPMPRGDQGGTGFPWPQGGGQQSPLPMPGGNAGGMPMPGGGRGIELPGGQVGGGMLWNVIRSILGAALGFKGGGMMSWLFRMIFMRYGWQILRTILGRGLLGR